MAKADIIKEFASLKGVGKAKAELLYDSGFDSLDKLKKASIKDLTKVKGVNEKFDKDIKDQLKETKEKKPKEEAKAKKEKVEKPKPKEKPKEEKPKTKKKEKEEEIEEEEVEEEEAYKVKKKPKISECHAIKNE